MKIFGLKFVVCLGTLVQDGLAHMRGVIWRAAPAKLERDAPAKFKLVQGCVRWCHLKILGSEVLWCVGLQVWGRWFRVGTHAWCNVESCSGKVQNRDV